MNTTKVEKIGQEIQEIEERIKHARTRAVEANRELDRKEARMRELSPAVFSGNETAIQELEQLEAESEVLVRSRRVAVEAEESFAKELEDAKARRQEAGREDYKERYRELSAERDKINRKRDELAAELTEVLEEESRIRNDMAQELRHYDQDAANAMASSPNPTRRWLRVTFAGWLR
jgi:vacuolar-type H+-ATPase subunit D/Vma8